jgi:hypothetical protein
VFLTISQGKAEEWKRTWGLKPSMAIELYLQLAALMKVGMRWFFFEVQR